MKTQVLFMSSFLKIINTYSWLIGPLATGLFIWWSRRFYKKVTEMIASPEKVEQLGKEVKNLRAIVEGVQDKETGERKDGLVDQVAKQNETLSETLPHGLKKIEETQGEIRASEERLRGDIKASEQRSARSLNDTRLELSRLVSHEVERTLDAKLVPLEQRLTTVIQETAERRE